MASIKPCPFCGSFNTRVIGFKTSAGHETTVKCNDCDCTGPTKNYLGDEVCPNELDEAIKDWNKRSEL